MENEDLSIQFTADVAEFMALDPEFRRAVNEGPLSHEERDRIQALLLSVLSNPPQSFRVADGSVRNMDKKFPPRKALLRFLANLTTDPRYAAFIRPAPSSGDTFPMWRPDYTLSHDEQRKKRDGNDLFRSGQFQQALEVGLDLLRIPRLHRNPAIVGFVMNCYYRLRDFPQALFYAEKTYALESDNKTAIGVAMMSAHRLAIHDKALFYAEEMLKHDSRSKASLGIAALACQRSKRFEHALYYARQGLIIEPGNVTDTGILMFSNYQLGRFAEAYKYVPDLLNSAPESSANLFCATHIAFELHLHREVVEYGERLLALEPNNPSVLTRVLPACHKLGLRKQAVEYQRRLDRVRALERAEKAAPEAAASSS